MRLQNPASKQKGLSGPNADIVDQLLTNKKKRSRPISSSLEYQASDPTSISTVKSSPPKSNPRVKNQQPPPPQITATRARGSGGIPKTKLQLQDLEGMAEDEILQALYEDPDLAAAAAAAASDSNKSPPKEPPPKTTRRQPLSKYPTHVNDMMDNGIPYKQWIILLLLLGVAAYQIYKAVKPPQNSKKKGGSKGVALSKKTRSIGDKGKRKKSESKNPGKVDGIVIAVDNSATPPDVRPGDKTTTAKKKTKAAVAKATKPAKKSTKQIQQPESPDSVSTDGSSSTVDVIPAFAKATKEKKTDDQASSSVSGASNNSASKKNGRVDDIVEGWQKVSARPDGKQKVQDEPAAPASSSATNGATKKVESVQKLQNEKFDKVSKTSSLAEEQVNVTEKVKGEAPSEAPFSKNETAAEKAKRSRKKKNKAATVVTEVAMPVSTTEDDATIALKLQKEEEKLAEATDRVESEPAPEVWKEVATKKRKGTAPLEGATFDPAENVDETIS
jgi:hypothetical protein